MSDYRDRIAAVFFTTLPSFSAGNCVNTTIPDAFFPNDKDIEAINFAKAICADCPVRIACLEYALEQQLDHGIFGGTTPAERRRLKPRRDKRRATYTLSGGAA